MIVFLLESYIVWMLIIIEFKYCEAWKKMSWRIVHISSIRKQRNPIKIYNLHPHFSVACKTGREAYMLSMLLGVIVYYFWEAIISEEFVWNPSEGLDLSYTRKTEQSINALNYVDY